MAIVPLLGASLADVVPFVGRAGPPCTSKGYNMTRTTQATAGANPPTPRRKTSAKQSSSRRPSPVNPAKPAPGPSQNQRAPKEKLKFIAGAAGEVAAKIRLCFPIKGQRWNFRNDAPITEVHNALWTFEFEINPDSRGFDDPTRRDFDRIAGIPLFGRQVLRAALQTVIKRYDAVLLHYGIADRISTNSDPALLTWPRVPKQISAKLIEDLELAASTLAQVVEECSDFLDEPTPSWDSAKGHLWYDCRLCLTLAVRAYRARLVLDSFQEMGWPEKIDDPLPPKVLNDTIKNLRKKLTKSPVTFHADGTGKAICWKRI